MESICAFCERPVPGDEARFCERCLAMFHRGCFHDPRHVCEPEPVHRTVVAGYGHPRNACGADWMATTSSPYRADVTCPACRGPLAVRLAPYFDADTIVRMNPRYLAYVLAQGSSSLAEQRAKDTEQWPGGRMCGFILWSDEQWRLWRKERGLPRNEPVLDHTEHEEWLCDRLGLPRATLST